jgi:8-oxo-dGTP pyrophosphatase MutT (NUDIX family)
MRQISNAIIYKDWKILVVDKPKAEGKVLTILPWWKVDPGETYELALQRELEEELWVKSRVWKILWEIQWDSPTSQITSNVVFFQTELESEDLITTQEVCNPRYLSSQEILTLETTTELTKNIIRKLCE